MFEPAKRSPNGDSPRAGLSEARNTVETSFSATVQSGTGAHLASYITGIWLFLKVNWQRC